MCTILIWHQQWEEAPLVVACNRDEALGRPSAPPEVREIGGRRCLAPRDLQAGGTWMGVNDAGVFVGITNRFGSEPDPSRESRGAVVAEALGYGSSVEALAQLEQVDPRRFNPFHLVVADRSGGGILVSEGETLRREPLARGLSMVTERSFQSEVSGRETLLRTLVGEVSESAQAPSDAALRSILGRHGETGFNSVCVHEDDLGYGTLSSAILRLGSGPGELEFLSCDGPPCTSLYQPFSFKLA